MSDILTNVNNFMFILIILSNLHNFFIICNIKIKAQIDENCICSKLWNFIYISTSTQKRMQKPKNNLKIKIQKQFKNQNPKTI